MAKYIKICEGKRFESYEKKQKVEIENDKAYTVPLIYRTFHKTVHVLVDRDELLLKKKT